MTSLSNISLTIILLTIPLLALTQKAELPIHLADNLILIEGRINDRSGLMVLDLGTSDLVLNRSYFTGKLDHTLSATGLNGSQSKVEACIVNLSLGPLNWKKQPAKLISLTHLEKAKDREILGLIGGKLLSKTEMIIDLSKMHVQITNAPEVRVPQHKSYETLGAKPVSVPMKFKGGMPLVPVQINGISFKFGLDTASELTLINKKHLSMLTGVLTKRGMLKFRGVSGKEKKVPAAKVTNIQVASLTCFPLKALFTDLALINQNLTGPIIDGILGFDFFRQFKVGIDFKNSALHLWRHKSSLKVPLLAPLQFLSDTSSVVSENQKKGDR